MAGWLRGLADPSGTLPAAIARGFLAALVPGLALLLLRVALAGAWQVPPGARPSAAFALYSVAGAPVVETAAMQAIAFGLARAGVGRAAQVASLTVLGALAHAAFGSWWNALLAAWPFFVYATVLCAWRERSERAAFAAAASVHALYNGALILLIAVASAASR